MGKKILLKRVLFAFSWILQFLTMMSPRGTDNGMHCILQSFCSEMPTIRIVTCLFRFFYHLSHCYVCFWRKQNTLA